MKNQYEFIYRILFLLCCNFSHSQIISGVVLDSTTRQPVELANIYFRSSNFNVFSDTQGGFNIYCNDFTEDLIVSNIGYKTKKVKLLNKQDAYFIYLVPDVYALNEIVIPVNHKKSFSHEKLISKRDDKQFVGFQFNTEHCVYIQNPYNRNGKIKNIVLQLDKQTGYIENKKLKLDYLASFNIKFYNYDRHTNKPGNEIYHKNIIIEPENKTGSFTINVDSLNIQFPKNGICVGVEIINTKYKNSKQTFAFIGPVLGFYENRQFSPSTSWIRYRNENSDFKTVIMQDFKSRKYLSLIVDLVADIEKD